MAKPAPKAPKVAVNRAAPKKVVSWPPAPKPNKIVKKAGVGNIGRKCKAKTPKYEEVDQTGLKTVKVRDLSNGSEYELPKKIARKYKIRPEDRKQRMLDEDEDVVITETTNKKESFGGTETETKTTREIARIPQDLFKRLYGLDKEEYVWIDEGHTLKKDTFPAYFDVL